MQNTVLFVLLLSVFSFPGKAQHSRPNLIIFVADDLGAIDMNLYGNKVVKTPEIDRLRKESLLFTHAFAASPTCGPSRSSLLTGLYPMRHGAHGNHSGVRAGTLSMVHYLRKLGYKVAIAGKLHVGPEEAFPFERIAGTNTVEPGFEKTPGLHYDLNLAPVDKWLGSQHNDTPFVLLVADHSPHVVWPEKATYDPSRVDIPDFHIDTEDTRKARARYYTDITKMDTNVGILLRMLSKHHLAQDAVVVFTADQGPQWAFGKWSLYDYGIRVPLLVRWPGTVKPGAKTDALVSLADVLPTVIEIAGGRVPEGLDGKSFFKVLSNGSTNAGHKTIFASHTGDAQMNRSPMRMLRNSRYKYILNLAPAIPYTTHMDKATDHDGGREYWPSWREKALNDPHAAAVLQRYHNRPQEELYDLQTDPSEKTNLAANAAYKKMLEKFRAEMTAIRRQQGDTETGPEKPAPKPATGPRKPVAPYIF